MGIKAYWLNMQGIEKKQVVYVKFPAKWDWHDYRNIKHQIDMFHLSEYQKPIITMVDFSDSIRYPMSGFLGAVTEGLHRQPANRHAIIVIGANASLRAFEPLLMKWFPNIAKRLTHFAHIDDAMAHLCTLQPNCHQQALEDITQEVKKVKQAV